MNGLDLRVRNVVITGSSTGIGEACALRLDELGYRVFAGVRQKTDGMKLQMRASSRLVPIEIDVTDPTTLEVAANLIGRQIGDSGLHGLINNAGIVVAGPLEALPIQDIRRQLEVNVLGQLATSQVFLPLLRQAQGRIINMGSMGGKVAMPFNGPYHASKFALEALSDALRVELRPWGIRVILIEPGIITTPIWGKSVTAAHELLQYSSTAAHLYRPTFLQMQKVANWQLQIGSSPDTVARTVVRAMRDTRPKSRYRVGRLSRLSTSLFANLPDSWRDFIIAAWLPKYP